MNTLEIGEYLKKLRVEQGLTLIKLSELSGVSQPYISQLENGKVGTPSINVLEKLAEPLGANLTKLLMVISPQMENEFQNKKMMLPIDSIKQDPLIKISNKEKSITRKNKEKNALELFGQIENLFVGLKSNRTNQKKDGLIAEVTYKIEDLDINIIQLKLTELIDYIVLSNQLISLYEELGEVKKEILEVLNAPPITYNGHLLDSEECKRIETMLPLLFPQYVVSDNPLEGDVQNG